MVRDVITAYVDGATGEGYAEDWDLDALWTALKTLYPVGITADSLTRKDHEFERDDLTREELLEALLKGRRTCLCRTGSRTRGNRRRGCDAPAGTQRAAQRHRP